MFLVFPENPPQTSGGPPSKEVVLSDQYNPQQADNSSYSDNSGYSNQ
mgnify:CR=1 FL=1